jgi:hypothetical protein
VDSVRAALIAAVMRAASDSVSPAGRLVLRRLVSATVARAALAGKAAFMKVVMAGL